MQILKSISIVTRSEESDSGLASVRESCFVTGVSLRVRKAAPETSREAHYAPTNTATCSTVSTAHRTAVADTDERDRGAENGEEEEEEEEEEEDELIPPPPTEFATRATSGVAQGANEENGDDEAANERQEDDSATPIEADGQL